MRLEVGGGPDGWAPPVSHQGEKRGKGGDRLAGGRRPREWDARAGGVWAERPNGEKGERNSFLFFKQFFNAFSKWIFNQFDICFQNTHHIKECSSMNAT